MIDYIIFGLVVASIIMFYYIQKTKFRILNRQLNKIQEKQKKDFKQIIDLISISKLIENELVLPRLRTEWSVYPDFILNAMKIIQLSKPKLIVELGTGSSTIYLGYWLKKIGGGKIISFESDKTFYNQQLALIREHFLDEFIKLVYAPLEEIIIDDFKGKWYSLDSFTEIDNINMLIVDGPVGYNQKLARYPALPILLSKLSNNSEILVDDALRQDEKTMCELWKQKFNGLTSQNIDTETGSILLHFAK